MEEQDPALRRILDDVGDLAGDDLVNVLAERLGGADLTTLLLAAMSRRTATMTAPEVLRRDERHRLTVPSLHDGRRVHDVVGRALAALPSSVEVLGLSPVVPLGTHKAVAGVHQDRVASSVRGTEVAADPTVGLALHAAHRRRALQARDPRSTTAVRLAAVQRVLRTQPFVGDRNLAHFTLLATVTAGRDTGNRTFERTTVRADLPTLITATLATGVAAVQIRATNLSDRQVPVLTWLHDAVEDDRVTVVDHPDRQAGRNYYTTACIKLDAPSHDGHWGEVGDGGFVEWGGSLGSNRKERLWTAAISIERLVDAVDGIDQSSVAS